jgi:hypothetical protein
LVIVGTAKHAKRGPVVVDGDTTVYLLDVRYWAPGVLGKRVWVEGEVERNDAGDLVMRKCKWHVL